MLLQCPATLLAAASPLFVRRAPPSCPPRLPSPLIPSGGRSRTSDQDRRRSFQDKRDAPPDRAQTSRPPSQRSAAPTHYSSRHGSPDPDDITDDQLHHLLAIVQSQQDKRTRRSKIAADPHSIKAYLAATSPVEFALDARVTPDYASDNSSESQHPLRPEIMPDSD